MAAFIRALRWQNFARALIQRKNNIMVIKCGNANKNATTYNQTRRESGNCCNNNNATTSKESTNECLDPTNQPTNKRINNEKERGVGTSMPGAKHVNQASGYVQKSAKRGKRIIDRRRLYPVWLRPPRGAITGNVKSERIRCKRRRLYILDNT